MTPEDIDHLAYEECIATLEKGIAALEHGTLSLEASIQKYAECQALSQRADQLLRKAEAQMRPSEPATDRAADATDIPF